MITTSRPVANPFLQIRSKSGDADRSLQWYQDQIKTLNKSSYSSRRLMQNAPMQTSVIIPGHMYLFTYDAKHKDKLPFWDKFPLVLPFKKVTDGFYGINLHYLPYQLRFDLLGALHKYASDQKINENTRIEISWKILQTMSRVAPVENCVKRYLYTNVQSNIFLNIAYPDWVTAALLPVERFVSNRK